MRKIVIAAVAGGILAFSAPAFADTIMLSPHVRAGFHDYIVTERVPPAQLAPGYVVTQPLPPEIELYPMPDLVVTQVPEYRDYRYVHVNDKIYIVEPVNRSIVAVVEQ